MVTIEEAERQVANVTLANNWPPLYTDIHNVTVISALRHCGAVVAAVHTDANKTKVLQYHSGAVTSYIKF